MKITVTPNKHRKMLERLSGAMGRVLASELSEDELLDMVGAFPAWEPDQAIEQGEDGAWSWKGKKYSTLYLSYDETLYRVISPHTTQADWTPDVSHSLFAEVTPPGTIPVWQQPTGGHDAYDTGDKVEWPEGGKVWQSTIDANTTEPGTLTEHGYWVEV